MGAMEPLGLAGGGARKHVPMRPAVSAGRQRRLNPLRIYVDRIESKTRHRVSQGIPMSAAPPAPAEDGEAPKKKLAGKTLVLFIILPAVLVVGGGAAAAMMLFGGGAPAAHAEGEDHKEKKKDEHADKKDGEHKADAKGEGLALEVSSGEGVTNVGLPQMMVNMATDDGRPAILKLKLTIEAKSDETVEALEARLPRVMDQFQGFLRELRVDDLAGSAGTARLRLELLRRVNLAIAPVQAHAVLIEEMLVQ